MADTGYVLPTVSAQDSGVENDWTNPDNALIQSDAQWANAGGVAAAFFLTGFAGGFSSGGLQSGDTINGFEILVRTADDFNDEAWHLEIGHDAVSNVVADYTLNRCPAVSGNCYSGDENNFADFVIGSSSNLLGFTGDADDLLDTNAATRYRICIQLAGSGLHAQDAFLAYALVKVYYTSVGGGAGYSNKLALLGVG